MKWLSLVTVITFLLFSCGGDDPVSVDKSEKIDSLSVGVVLTKGEVEIVEPTLDDEVVVLESQGIKLTEIKVANNANAQIELNTKQFSEGKNHLSFSVEGVFDYSIAYLANNYSLSQFTADIFNIELLYGNNVFLAFLTDKNGISIKTNKGSVLRNAVLGGVESLFDMKQPHLFYHLPQTNVQKPVLDFYLVNTSISKNGNKVKAIINGVEFIIDKWAAYEIGGLKESGNSIRIQLIDKDGALIEGPFNDSGERQFAVDVV